MSAVVTAIVLDGDVELPGRDAAVPPPKTSVGDGPRTLEGHFRSPKDLDSLDRCEETFPPPASVRADGEGARTPRVPEPGAGPQTRAKSSARRPSIPVLATIAASDLVAPRSSTRPMNQAEYTRRNRRRRRMVEQLALQTGRMKGR